jgi:uncharacterized BrkB/YihY/UPF0761 family membrane protein
VSKPQYPWLELLKQEAPYSHRTIWLFRLAGLLTVVALIIGYWAIFRALSGHLPLMAVMGTELAGLIIMIGSLAAAFKSRQADICRYQNNRDNRDK